MSVLACERRGCPNIMCDRLILGGTRYICHDCFQELDEWRQTWTPDFIGLVRQSIQAFMDSPPGTFRQPGKSLEAEFEMWTQ